MDLWPTEVGGGPGADLRVLTLGGAVNERGCPFAALNPRGTLSGAGGCWPLQRVPTLSGADPERWEMEVVLTLRGTDSSRCSPGQASRAMDLCLIYGRGVSAHPYPTSRR